MVSGETSQLSNAYTERQCHHYRKFHADRNMPVNFFINKDVSNYKKSSQNEADSIHSYVSGLLEEICDKALEEANTDPVRYRENHNPSQANNHKVTNRNTYILENRYFIPHSVENGGNRSEKGQDFETDECYNFEDYKFEAMNKNVTRLYVPKEASDNIKNVIKSSEHSNKNASSSKEQPQKPKLSKKLSFSSFFGKKDKKSKPKEIKHEETAETYDKFEFENVPKFNHALARTTKYASAVELNQKSATLQRTPSFIKKLMHVGQNSKSLLKRSFSFRDVSHNTREHGKATELKTKDWKNSLQSLVENDCGVSYNDLSFIDYDALNSIHYDDAVVRRTKSVEKNVSRTRSMMERRSYDFRPQIFQRGTSILETSRSSLCLLEQSEALSLPSLPHTNLENVNNGLETSPQSYRYRRRPQSVCSEDGGRRSRVSAASGGSFRSASGGCAKLKRHNACRQKSRTDIPSIPVQKRDDQTVRSRSLNHLDALEMRQGVVSTTDPLLKDTRSEPDCAKSLAPQVVGEDDKSTEIGDVVQHRKYMLSRSQKSSSECFSVIFEVGDESTWDNELFFPAQRGITLFESLSKQCELRNIDLLSCEARLQDKEAGTETPLPFAQDTAVLVGRQVRIIAKDSSNKKLQGSLYGNHSRKQSGSNKPRTSSFFSSSTEETSTIACSTLSLHDGEQGKKQIRQRFTAFFGNTKDTKFEALIDQLDKYSKLGIPNNICYQQGQCESIDALYKLEDDWRDLILAPELTEKQQQQQTALWELIKTEVAYIKTLKVVTDLFLACLKDLQSKNLLKEIDTEKLFSNITEILDANVIFWRNTLFPLVRDMRKYKRPPCLENMLEGFSAIQDIFQPYFKYCAEQSRCQHYCRERNLDSEVFTAYLTWCESQKDCNRLRLMDILVQPMQRLTKYGLLLKALLKNTDEDVEKENLQTMIKMVDDFVINVNSSLKHKQDKERLKGIIARIESYDIVDTKDDDIEKLLKREKIFTQLDLTRPMLNCPPDRKRHLLLEGDLKLKDSNASKVEVHCFLLTDMLLICKPSTKKGGATMKVIRQPYLVDRLVIYDLQKETPSLGVIYKNEFDMAITAFILQNNDIKKLKGWKEGISKAQTLYSQAKQLSYGPDENLETGDYNLEYNLEADYSSLQLAPRSPIATSSRASRVSSLAHSHSGSVEMNDQSSLGSVKEPSRCVSMEAENRTASLSSDEGVQPLPPDKSPVSQKNSFRGRLFNKTPNTLSVQPYSSSLGQSLPNLTFGSPGVGSGFSQNTLNVPSKNAGGHLLSPTHRGISYPPPSPTRGNLRRGLAISQSKNPPLIKTRHVNSTASTSQQAPTSFDFDVPVIAGVSQSEEDNFESFSRGQHRQAVKRVYRNDKRYHTAGVVDDIKKNNTRDSSIHKRLSWNCTSRDQEPLKEDHT